MKFSHSIQFNAVPDWASHYIAYSNLKKMYTPAIRQGGKPAYCIAESTILRKRPTRPPSQAMPSRDL
jgi:hypothetical protein